MVNLNEALGGGGGEDVIASPLLSSNQVVGISPKIEEGSESGG